MFASTLVNNVISSVLFLSLSEAEMVGMAPFTGAMVASGKVVSPMMAAAGIYMARNVGIAQWDTTLGFWAILTFGVLVMCCCSKQLLTPSSSSSSSSSSSDSEAEV